METEHQEVEQEEEDEEDEEDEEEEDDEGEDDEEEKEEEEGEEEMCNNVPEGRGEEPDNETDNNLEQAGAVSLLPAETLNRKESVELWKSRNETDVIVSDHDVFGLHEGEEDSLDSLVLRPDIDSSYDINDDTTMSSDILLSSLGQLAAQQSSFLLEQEESEGSLRPKRKSGSLSELSLPGSLPLKKQRPESLLYPSQQPGSLLLETPESAECDEGMTICDTAPTSPRSPPPCPQVARCQGRSLIPDRENPPLEMLSWVSTFSRWSHAERLLAINQLIDR